MCVDKCGTEACVCFSRQYVLYIYIYIFIFILHVCLFLGYFDWVALQIPPHVETAPKLKSLGNTTCLGLDWFPVEPLSSLPMAGVILPGFCKTNMCEGEHLGSMIMMINICSVTGDKWGGMICDFATWGPDSSRESAFPAGRTAALGAHPHRTQSWVDQLPWDQRGNR